MCLIFMSLHEMSLNAVVLSFIKMYFLPAKPLAVNA